MSVTSNPIRRTLTVVVAVAALAARVRRHPGRIRLDRRGGAARRQPSLRRVDPSQLADEQARSAELAGTARPR